MQDCAITAPSTSNLYVLEEVDYPSRPARLVAVCVDRGVHVYDIARKEKLAHFELAFQVTCLNLDADGLEMLVNLSCDEVWSIDLDNGDTRQLYKGQKQGNFVIRSCFGGASEGFVVSGSEGKQKAWPRSPRVIPSRFYQLITSQTPRSLSGTAIPVLSSRSSRPTRPAASMLSRGTLLSLICSPQQVTMPACGSGSHRLVCKPLVR